MTHPTTARLYLETGSATQSELLADIARVYAYVAQGLDLELTHILTGRGSWNGTVSPMAVLSVSTVNDTRPTTALARRLAREFNQDCVLVVRRAPFGNGTYNRVTFDRNYGIEGNWSQLDGMGQPKYTYRPVPSGESAPFRVSFISS